MTAKTLAQLTILLADNVSGDISPADLRDFLDTMHPAFGGLYFSTPAATTCTDAATFYKAAGTTTSTSLNRATMPANNRLTYTGTPSVHAHIALSLSFTMSGSNDVIAICVAVNGVSQTGSIARRKVGTGTDIGSTALHWDVPLATNDYIEVFVSNNDAASTTVTVEDGYLFFLGMMV